MNRNNGAVLSKDLPGNISYLASLIARKPASFSPEWASTPDEAFSLYTNTSTVNLFLSLNDILAEHEWPFPAYLDLQRELASIEAFENNLGLVKSLLRDGLTLTALVTVECFETDDVKRQMNLSSLMRYLFWRHSRRIFRFWERAPELSAKQDIVREIRRTYRRNLWWACTQTTLSLTDHLMRDYFKTTNLLTSVKTLRSALEKAHVSPKDFKPGYAICDGRKDPSKGNALARTMDEDLRLPGVLLSSFVEFANTYYADTRMVPRGGTASLNRHAIVHCGSDHVTLENAVRTLSFFDLSLRLAPVLRILIHGPKAGPRSRVIKAAGE